jgi:hypothetical protein
MANHEAGMVPELIVTHVLSSGSVAAIEFDRDIAEDAPSSGVLRMGDPATPDDYLRVVYLSRGSRCVLAVGVPFSIGPGWHVWIPFLDTGAVQTKWDKADV